MQREENTQLPIFCSCLFKCRRHFNIPFRVLLLWALSFFISTILSCSPDVHRVAVSPKASIVEKGFSSSDLSTVCSHISESLQRVPVIRDAEGTLKIAFFPIDNRSKEYIETGIIQEKIRMSLEKNCNIKIIFLDRNYANSILQGRKRTKQNKLQGSESLKINGASYFLSGAIFSIDKAGTAGLSQFYRFSFKLTDVKTDAIVWEDEYEFKKVVRRAIWER